MNSKLTPVLFAFSFLSAANYVMLRTLAVSLFLARVGTDSLPLILAVSAVIVLATSVTMRSCVRRFSTGRCAFGSWLMMSAVALVLASLIGLPDYAALAVGGLYVFAEIRGCLGTIFTVSLSNDAFAHSESKRPYAVVASGAPIAGVIVGFLLGVEARFVEEVDLLFIIATLDGLTAGMLWAFRRELRGVANVAPEAGQPNAIQNLDRKYDLPMSNLKTAISPRQYRWQLSMLMALKIVVLTLIAFQWKVAVADFYDGNEKKLVAYFALFYAISDILIVAFQWLAAGELLDRLGIGAALKSFPIALGAIGACAYWLDTPTALIFVFSILRGLNVLRRSFHDPALSAAYSILDPTIRRETIVIVKGIIKPIAETVTAIGLVFVGATFANSTLTFAWLLVLVPWFFFATSTSKAYSDQEQSDDVKAVESSNH